MSKRRWDRFYPLEGEIISIGVYENRDLHFPFSKKSLYGLLPGSLGYGDKWRCVIDAADPGAVPGSSTKIPELIRTIDGAELGSTCVQRHCFCPA